MFSTLAAGIGFILRSHMTDENESSAEATPQPPAESAPRVRRISNARPKKVAKEIPAKESSEPESTAELPSIPFPSSKPREASQEDDSPSSNDWPESDAEAAGAPSSPSESAKRKRRRRKGKGQSNAPQNSAAEPSSEEPQPPAALEPRIGDAPQDQRPRPQPGPQAQPQHQAPHRPKIDPELLTKMAWKIYLAEVSEEGVALIGDNDAKDLSRRCFRLAEIFIEEQSRRR
jgi:hypothetical protein